MCKHIKTVRPTADVERYADLYTLGPHECAGMKAIFNKQKKSPDIKISEYLRRTALVTDNIETDLDITDGARGEIDNIRAVST